MIKWYQVSDLSKKKKEKLLNSETKRFKKTRQSTPEKEARFSEVIKAMRD